MNAYQLVDGKTKKIIKLYPYTDLASKDKARKLANRFADKLDLKYGAVRYIVI